MLVAVAAFLLAWMLAAVDGATMAQWAYNAIVTVVLVVYGRKNAEVDSLRAELKDEKAQRDRKVEELVNAKFEATRLELAGSMKMANHLLAEMQKRLDRGEEIFERLKQADVIARVDMIERFAEASQQFATKEDLRGVCKQVEDMKRDVGRQLDQVIGHLAGRPGPAASAGKR